MPEPIEVEVIEIDGAPPPVRQEDPYPDANAGRWQDWFGRLSTLDRRWWPVWVLLGLLAVGVVTVAAVVFAACWAVFAFLRFLLRILTGLPANSPDSHLRQTRH